MRRSVAEVLENLGLFWLGRRLDGVMWRSGYMSGMMAGQDFVP